nr:hypothetical protein [Kibdelosporangium sp. MJ126-NF4]CTQ98287.1 hypothetical protein [Kibdelosporangium sp. MJ126-NF4]
MGTFVRLEAGRPGMGLPPDWLGGMAPGPAGVLGALTVRGAPD